MKTVIIIGAGASGMMAAITAAKNRENKVILLERQQRAGKKLLSTGNGRCNLTNTGASPENYHGAEPEFVSFALSEYPPESVRQTFRELGLLTVEEPGGRVYPLSDSANSVLDVLRFACSAAGVQTETSREVTGIVRNKRGFRIETAEESMFADKVIVACGGMAGAKVGGTSLGYGLLSSLGHSRTSLHPALVQLTVRDDRTKALKGVRADGRIKIYSKRELLAESRGEIQFTEKGISGPATFEISRAVSVSGEALRAELDLLADYKPEEILELLKCKREAAPYLAAENFLTGILHNRLGKVIIKYCDIDGEEPAYGLSDGKLKDLVAACKGFALDIKGTEGYDSAQVTAGGIKTSEFDPRTMESRLCPGLFACGEVLDIDGDCGGFNLQWAWASGMLAGRSV